MSTAAPDITARKHHGSPTSADAFDRIRASLSVRQTRVWCEVISAGSDGLTCDELAAKWGVGLNVISGRFSELAAANLIRSNGRRPTRSGTTAQVWRAAEFQFALPI